MWFRLVTSEFRIDAAVPTSGVYGSFFFKPCHIRKIKKVLICIV